MAPVLVVTGGSRGIGAATSTLAAHRGYAVCVNYRTRAADAESLWTAMLLRLRHASGQRAFVQTLWTTLYECPPASERRSQTCCHMWSTWTRQWAG